MPSFSNGLRFERIVVPTPYAVGPANVYVFPSTPVTLFDCGPNTPATENALLLGLAAIGLAPEQIARIVISHAHPDHYGLAPRLREMSGARILVGERDLPKLADRSMLVATGRLLLRAGMPMEELVEMGERERNLGSDIRPEVEEAAAIQGGDRVQFEDFDLDVLHLPGHTAGHVCLYHGPSRVLFSGDTLLLDISPNPLIEPDPMEPTERRRSLVEYLASLDRLSELPLSTVFPGHGPPIEDPRAVIEEMRSHHRRRTETLARMLDEGGKSAWQLANELFPRLEGFDNFLAVSEVVAHIDLLVDQGLAEPLERDGITLYRRRSS
ncbi:MAG TPA: MBL fold metallo-hydrolase [Actinomycetota bacterium]|jgi:glyoxylase-like metal-dependent hydrolase (beta-lactamase superfamily II)|nr:MBL fold metallo-hydrolase [Actinomycetota bacterium]